MRWVAAGVFAGAVLGVCLGWLAILLGAPETAIDPALAVILVTGGLGGVGGFFVVRRRGSSIG